MNDTIPGHDLHMARLTPEFSKWQAHLGFRVRQTEQWAPWSILRDKYGWPTLTRATERCECNDAGFKNVNIVARICADMKRQEADAAKQAAQPVTPKPQTTAADWAALREKVRGYRP